MWSLRAAVLLMAGALLAPGVTMAYEKAFEKSPVGVVQVRTLPSGRLLTTETAGSYFDRSGELFRRLFDYIREHDVSMTVPVEGQLERAEMRFYVGSDAPGELLATESVRIAEVPTRRVVSLGGRGSYSESNLRETREALQRWLAEQDRWAPAGEPYAVFWNGPFTPWFMKRYEVHIPVDSRGPTEG